MTTNERECNRKTTVTFLTCGICGKKPDLVEGQTTIPLIDIEDNIERFQAYCSPCFKGERN